MLFGILGTSLLGNNLAGKEMTRAEKGNVRAGHGNKKGKESKIEWIFNAALSFN